MAANYMNVGKDASLMRLMAAKCADLVQKMDRTQFMDFFGFQNEYSPEEEAKVLAENTWPFPKTN